MKNLTKTIRYSFYALLSIVLMSCDTEGRTDKTTEWISSHKKPILVTTNSRNGWTLNYRYTLIDPEANMFSTGEINLVLPDTIDVYSR